MSPIEVLMVPARARFGKDSVKEQLGLASVNLSTSGGAMN